MNEHLNFLPSIFEICISHFSSCYDKVPDKIHLTEQGFILVYSFCGYVVHQKEGLAGGTQYILEGREWSPASAFWVLEL